MNEECTDDDCPGCTIRKAIESVLDQGYPEEMVINMVLDVLGNVMEEMGHVLEFTGVPEIPTEHGTIH